MSSDYSMFDKLYEAREESFHLFGTNGGHVSAENERITTAGLRCGQNLVFGNFALFNYPKKCSYVYGKPDMTKVG